MCRVQASHLFDYRCSFFFQDGIPDLVTDVFVLIWVVCFWFVDLGLIFENMWWYFVCSFLVCKVCDIWVVVEC
jgi:hypothetical protein